MGKTNFARNAMANSNKYDAALGVQPESKVQDAAEQQSVSDTSGAVLPGARVKSESRSIRQQYLLPPSLLDRVKTASEKTGASRNSIAVAALEKYLSENGF